MTDREHSGFHDLIHALLRIPTLLIKLCCALLRFPELSYALCAFSQIVTKRLKILNSLKFFGALAACNALYHALRRYRRFDEALLRFLTLRCRFARRFKAPSKRRWCELGIRKRIYILHVFILKKKVFSRTSRPISIKFVTNYSWVMGLE